MTCLSSSPNLFGFFCFSVENIYHPASVTCLCQKKQGPQRKECGCRYVLGGFVGFLYEPPAWNFFLWRPAKFSKVLSFGGGDVCFSILCRKRPKARGVKGKGKSEQPKGKRKGRKDNGSGKKGGCVAAKAVTIPLTRASSSEGFGVGMLCVLGSNRAG